MKRPILVSFALLLGYAAWWLFWQSPERQIDSAQARFLAGLEGHDWDDVRAMLAPEFVTSGGHNADTVMPDLKQALGDFVTLDIESNTITLQASKDLGMISQTIRLVGLGAGLSVAVRERANQIRTPWLFHWRKNGSWPWNWQLTQVHNDTFP
jgi:hypothetical protein